jgi:hypothetical protein
MWYLVTEPNFDSKNTLNEFGFVDLFNGIGFFVYKKGGRFFMRAFQDLGVSQIDYDLIQADTDAIAYGGDPQKGCELFFKEREVQFIISVT